MGVLFGLFQGFMPLIGYYAGYSFAKKITDYDHWVAFILLGAIGLKMLIEGLKPIDPKCEIQSNPFGWKILIMLSLLTSIDALATGIIFVPFSTKITFAVLIIGFISFLFSIVGVYLGVRFRDRIKINANLLGGIILIAIGLKILIEHIYYL